MERMEQLKIELGRKYDIEYVIDRLEKLRNIKIGHAKILSEHLYFLGPDDLRDILKKIKEKGAEFERKRNSTMIVLSIMDPLKKYGRFIPFYDGMAEGIKSEIVEIGGSIATEKDVLIEEGLKLGFKLGHKKGVEDKIEQADDERKEYKEFIEGMRYYFDRLDINASEERQPHYPFKTFILFKPTREFARQIGYVERERDERGVSREEGVEEGIREEPEVALKIYSEFMPVYSGIEEDILGGIKSRADKTIAVRKRDLVDTGKQAGLDLSGIGYYAKFIEGLKIYYDVIGVSVKDHPEGVVFKERK